MHEAMLDKVSAFLHEIFGSEYCGDVTHCARHQIGELLRSEDVPKVTELGKHKTTPETEELKFFKFPEEAKLDEEGEERDVMRTYPDALKQGGIAPQDQMVARRFLEAIREANKVTEPQYIHRLMARLRDIAFQ